MVSTIIGKLISLIYRSIFLYGDMWYRHSSIALNLFFTILSIYIVSLGMRETIIVLAIAIALYILFKAFNALIATTVISSIPAAWLALTNLIFTGISIDALYKALEIFTRAITIAIAVLLFLLMMNPIELSNYLCRVMKKPSCLYPVVLWRVVPMVMKDSSDSLIVMKLKNEKIWKALAVTILSSLERAEAMEQVFEVKKHRLKKVIRYEYNYKALAIITIAILIEMLVLFTRFNYFS